ncbi:MAG: hypothetical protein ACFBSG_15135 [Leptolyngbyaceae cyanobacterium]
MPSSIPTLTETAFYFVKLYTYEREAVFGSIAHESGLVLNGMGQVAADEWQRSSKAYPTLMLDKWLLLPDRLEGIISLREPVGTNRYGSLSNKPRILSSFVASYKAAAAKRINLLRNSPGSPLWQKGYQERFIPDVTILKRLQQTLEQQVNG